MIGRTRLQQVGKVIRGNVIANMNKKSNATMESKLVEEIRIPVPWGHVAGKWWGRQDCRPVVALHGLFDNCASFDRLIPQLNAPSVLALDAPGHGLSSSLPRGLALTVTDCILALRFIFKKHYNWDKVTLLGHSFGSILGFIYSGLFFDDVDKFISIDCARFHSAPRDENIAAVLRAAMDICSEGDDKVVEKPFDQLLDLFYAERKAKKFDLPKDLCEILLRRSTRQTESGLYTLTVDPRLPHFIDRTPLSMIEALARRITCPMMSIRATRGVISGRHLDLYEKELLILKQSSVDFESLEVEGGHQVHFEEPEKIAPLVNRFLSKPNPKPKL